MAVFYKRYGFTEKDFVTSLGSIRNSIYSSKIILKSALKTKMLTVNKSICNLDDVISSIQASSQTQEQKIDSLDTFNRNSEAFVMEVVDTDSQVADLIQQRKDKFYESYSYLKPDSEKNGWEKFCDGCQTVGEWCKENWKTIGKILITVVIVAALVVANILTGGVLTVILTGVITGALLGGITGGITSSMNGGSFLDGFADGALSGAVTGVIAGAAFAGIGAAGSAFGTFLGGSCKFAKNGGTIIKCMMKTTGVLSLGMGAFDALSLAAGLFNPDSPLAAFNKKLHGNRIYNVFQIGVSALAIFSAGAWRGMNAGVPQGPPACFVAGTMILTAAGLVAIERIKAGDKVLSTDAESFQTEEKTVLETYIREVAQLVHLTIKKEKITTTVDHPFYEKEKGFINAGELKAGDKVLNAAGETCFVENTYIEVVEKPEKVYNFQVEEFHTYYVGDNGILVHNADYEGGSGSKLQELFDTADNYHLSDDTFNNHILERHSSNSIYSNKSHFNADFDIKSGIDITLKGDNFIVKPNTGDRSGYIFEQTFKDAIGVNSKGKPIYTLKVVIDENGNVITAFPKK